MSNNNNNECNEWILVQKKQQYKKIVQSFVEKSINFNELDKLSQLIYIILTKYTKLIPTSFITKQVNMMLSQNNYNKHQIGHLLYEGPLKSFLYRCNKRIPTLWGLNKYGRNIIIPKNLENMDTYLTKPFQESVDT